MKPRMLAVWLASGLMFAATQSSCFLIDLPDPPLCVEGNKPGRIEVELIEKYVDGGTFKFDPTLVGLAGPSPQPCDGRPSFTVGDKLNFHVTSRRGTRGNDCSYFNADLIHPAVVGASQFSRDRAGPIGWIFVSANDISLAQGCRESFIAETYISHLGADPFAVPVAGTLPPALLTFSFAGPQPMASATCRACAEFWVVKLTQIAEP